jgi:hypothetical protein
VPRPRALTSTERAVKSQMLNPGRNNAMRKMREITKTVLSGTVRLGIWGY